MKPTATSPSPLPLLAVVTVALALAGLAAVAGTTACTSGTTPVCDDAGSCLLVAPSGDGAAAEEAGQGEGGQGGEDGGTD